MDATGSPPTQTAAADYRAQVAQATSPPADADAAVRLGHTLRALAQAAVGSTAPDGLLTHLADQAQRWTEELAPYVADTRYGRSALGGPASFVNHPMIGPANPCAPPIVMRPLQGEQLVGDVEFHTPQEGPPGFAYGGYIAAGFDAILLVAAGSLGVGGPTRSLSVRYRRPAPINTPLRYEGEVDTVEERYTRMRGRLMAGDVVCAEGTAEVARSGLRPHPEHR